MTSWLIDKSAYTQFGTGPAAEVWADRVERGLVRIATMTCLEIGYSARSGTDLHSERERPPLSRMPVEYLTPQIEDRAIEVQLLLSDRGQHRAPSVPDLLIAAVAELRKLTILHVDKDFDLIAAITGQSVERLQLRNKS